MMTTAVRFSLLPLVPVFLCAQMALAQDGLATLYSLNKYGKEVRTFCLDFKTGANSKRSAQCDLRYGSLYAGDDLDWFQSSSDRESRSVIKDLGRLEWTAEIKVPVVEPLPKLRPGEQRTISLDVSGADGADGAPGARGTPAEPGADFDGVVRQPRHTTPLEPSPTTKKKHDGKPKIDPMFVKAVVDHIYVIHVVDGNNDFYALFRVESLERGDRCEISWKIIDPPQDGSAVVVRK